MGEPMVQVSDLARLLADTAQAGWRRPLSVVRCSYRLMADSWDIVEADGTRIAIVGELPDARLIVGALEYVLDSLATTESRSS